MFVSTDDYPFFRAAANHSNKKNSRFRLENFRNTISHSQESLPEEQTTRKKYLKTEKNSLKKHKNQLSTTFLDSINEGTKPNETNRNITDINEENLSTLVKYKRLENEKKENPIFHLPPLLTKPSDPETTFLTFGELDELNERIFQNQQISIAKTTKNSEKNKLGLELTYNKSQYNKLTSFYNHEEKSSYKLLMQTLQRNKLKELRNPKIKTYSSQAIMAAGHGDSNFFGDIPSIPEKKNEQLTQQTMIVPDKRKEHKLKKGVTSFDSIYFESSVYFYTYEQLGWRPEIRELCTMILFEKKIFIYSGIGRNIMDDIVAADLGFKRESSFF